MTFVRHYANGDLGQWSKETVLLGGLLVGLYAALAAGGGWGEVMAVLTVAYVGEWVLVVYAVLALAKNLWDYLWQFLHR